MFKKKFKVRVVLAGYYLRLLWFSVTNYEVQFAYYRFIPIYSPLCFFFRGSWSPNLFGFEEAESIAKNLKSIDDVAKYHEPYEAKEREYLQKERDYYKKNVPYETKYF